MIKRMMTIIKAGAIVVLVDLLTACSGGGVSGHGSPNQPVTQYTAAIKTPAKNNKLVEHATSGIQNQCIPITITIYPANSNLSVGSNASPVVPEINISNMNQGKKYTFYPTGTPCQTNVYTPGQSTITLNNGQATGATGAYQYTAEIALNTSPSTQLKSASPKALSASNGTTQLALSSPTPGHKVTDDLPLAITVISTDTGNTVDIPPTNITKPPMIHTFAPLGGFAFPTLAGNSADINSIFDTFNSHYTSYLDEFTKDYAADQKPVVLAYWSPNLSPYTLKYLSMEGKDPQIYNKISPQSQNDQIIFSKVSDAFTTQFLKGSSSTKPPVYWVYSDFNIGANSPTYEDTAATIHFINPIADLSVIEQNINSKTSYIGDAPSEYDDTGFCGQYRGGTGYIGSGYTNPICFSDDYLTTWQTQWKPWLIPGQTDGYFTQFLKFIADSTNNYHGLISVHVKQGDITTSNADSIASSIDDVLTGTFNNIKTGWAQCTQTTSDSETCKHFSQALSGVDLNISSDVSADAIKLLVDSLQNNWKSIESPIIILSVPSSKTFLSQDMVSALEALVNASPDKNTLARVVVRLKANKLPNIDWPYLYNAQPQKDTDWSVSQAVNILTTSGISPSNIIATIPTYAVALNNAPTTPILQTTNNNLEPVCNNTTGLTDPAQNTPFFCTEGQPTNGNRAWNSHQTATAANPTINSPNTADNMDIGSTSSSGETTYHYLSTEGIGQLVSIFASDPIIILPSSG